MPVVLLIVMLAPLPRMVRALPAPKLWQTAIGAAAMGSLAAVVLAYPYFLPFVNSLAFGHPF
jgi:hypothetical protein